MANTLGMNKSHPSQNLPHVVFNLSSWDRLAKFFSLFDYLFQVFGAILKYYVLNAFSVLLLAVVNVNHLYAVFAVS